MSELEAESCIIAEPVTLHLPSHADVNAYAERCERNLERCFATGVAYEVE